MKRCLYNRGNVALLFINFWAIIIFDPKLAARAIFSQTLTDFIPRLILIGLYEKQR